jgi:UDP-glucose 4-epimerase
VSTPIVLFGAAGGIGRQVRALLPADREIIEVDRLLEPPCDAAEPADLERLLKRLPPRIVAVNVAGLVSTDAGPGALAGLLRSNVQAPAVVVAALAERLERLVHLSSVSVYGPPLANPVTEDHALAPDTPYGVSKATGERLVQLGCAAAGVPLTVIRATQLFGVASAHGTLPHALTRRLREGESPALTIDPATRRDYLHVTDLARLVARAAQEPVAGVFNAGSGDGVALGELFAVAYAGAGRTPPPTASGPSWSQWLDCAAARAAFGWQPRERVVDWVRAGGRDAA